jgi:flagellar basal body-associated protein FliL
MVKRILIFVVTFVVALGGATAVVVMRTKPEAPANKPATSDSTASAGHDSSSVRDPIAATDSAKTIKDSTPVTGRAAASLRESVRPVAARPPVRD